jgi:hypothetical protein
MAELCSQKAVLPPSLWGGAPTSIFKTESNGKKLLLGKGFNFNPWKRLEDGIRRFCCVVRHKSEKKRMKKTTAFLYCRRSCKQLCFGSNKLNF